MKYLYLLRSNLSFNLLDLMDIVMNLSTENSGNEFNTIFPINLDEN